MAAPVPPVLLRINSPPPPHVESEEKERARGAFNVARSTYMTTQNTLIVPSSSTLLTPEEIRARNINLTPEQINNITNLYQQLVILKNTYTNTQSKYNKYYLKYLKYKEKYLGLKKLL